LSNAPFHLKWTVYEPMTRSYATYWSTTAHHHPNPDNSTLNLRRLSRKAWILTIAPQPLSEFGRGNYDWIRSVSLSGKA